MINIFKKRFRIIEEKDTGGNIIFYPERTILGIFSRYDYSYIEPVGFDSYKEANEWMCRAQTPKKKTKKVHIMSETFNELSK